MKKNSLPVFKLWMYILLKSILTPWAKYFKYNVTTKNLKNIKKFIKPPYIILSNHTGFFDPFLVNMFLPNRVHWLMSESQLRSKFAKKLFSLVGVIAKNKATNDMSANIKIIKLIKAKHVVGIFPEGKRSWHGRTQNIYSGTGKLLKYLNVPVVVSVIKGLYLTEPRWANTFRKKKVEIEYKILFKENEIAQLSPEEILIKLEEALKNDDTAFAVKNSLKYKTKNGAEYLERLFFVCPKCKSLESIYSKENSVLCNKCDFNAEYQHDGTFDYENLSIGNWYDFQKDFISNYIERANDNQILVTENDSYIRKENENGEFEFLYEGKVEVTKKFIKFGNYSLPLSELKACQTTNTKKQFGQNFEFDYENKTYQLSSIKNKRLNVYKFIVILQKLFPINAELD